MLMTSKVVQVLARRLRELIPDGQVQQFAVEIGMDLASLSKLRSGKVPNPTLKTVERLAEALDVPVGFLLSGGKDLAPRTASVRELESQYNVTGAPTIESVTIGGVSFVPVPKLRDPIAAGKPILSDGHIEEVHYIRLDWIRRRLRGPVPIGRVVLLDVASGWLGSGMAPLIQPGATIFADRGPSCDGPSAFEPGAVYLVRHEGGITCKRAWLTAGSLCCHADNVTHPPFAIPLHRGDLDEIRDHIAARVFWVGNPVG